MTMPTPTGLLLFAHGARDPNWALLFQAVARQCRAARGEADDGPSTVALAFLEFMTPDLVTAGAHLVAAGCCTVVVVPLFLGAGGHVRKDIPRLLDELRSAHPATTFTLQPAVGESPRLAQAMAEIALEAGAQPGARP